MPNWCGNDLIVEGSGASQFYQDCLNESREFSLNTLVPLPKEQENNWYDWHIAHWGTKWDVEATLHNQSSDKVEISFSSAWSPPTEWVNNVADRYPDLTFTLLYEESGMCFAGRYVQQGNCILEDYFVNDIQEYIDFCVEELGFDRENFEDLEANM